MVDETKSDVATTPSAPVASDADQILLEEMIKAGVLYGRRKTKTHPRMRQYIFSTRNGIEILDIAQTLELVGVAAEFLKNIIKKKGTILIVGTTPAAKSIVKTMSEKLSLPYVVERWLGGTLTNFKTIHTRIQYFTKLKTDRAAGRLEKYTKKERLGFDKEIERLSSLFGGIETITRLPDALIIVGASAHETALLEARRMSIPVVALLVNDVDPDLIEYPIPANDRARSSIAWIMEKLEVAIEAGRKELAAMPQVEPAKNTAK